MIQGSPEPRFPLEPRGEVLGPLGVQPLDGHAPSQSLVLGEEDSGHPAGAQWPDHSIALGEEHAYRCGRGEIMAAGGDVRRWDP